VTVKKIQTKKPFSLTAFFLRWEWMLVALIVIAVIVNASLSPYFLRVDNLFDMTFNFMERGLMTLPMAFVIITAGIDLSVASNLAMSANIMGQLFALGVNIWIAAAIALAVGSLAGFFNAMLITRIKLPPLAATLGTYVLYRGIAWVLTQDGAVVGFPKAFAFIGQGDIPGTPIPIPLVLYFLLAIPFGLLLHRTTFGRYTFAIGNSPEACRFAGVRTDRILVAIYTLSGFMAALAGVMMASRFSSVRADIALGGELEVITAVVLGGVDIFGGSGTMPGVVLALFLLGIVRYGMNLMNVPPQIQIIATGLLLIVAIILPNVLRQLTTERTTVEGQAPKRRSWIPFAAAGAVVVVVVLALLLAPGRGTTPAGDGTSVAQAGPTQTPVQLQPTNTPPPRPPTPTPRPTNTPAPTPTLAPTVEGEAVMTPMPSPTPDPHPDLEMVEVPEGPFVMGADDLDPKQAPAHEVTLPTFYIDKFEVTNNAFAKFVAATDYVTEGEATDAKKTWRTFYDPSKESHPVVKVSFNDAQAFCEWMDKRLPTEEEWEKAARGTDEREYPWGDLWDTTRANVKATGFRSTVAVGSFSGGASPYGAEDMAGNVGEWTTSPFVAYPGSTYEDPQYTEEARITRGGGWFDDQNGVRTTARNAAFPATANDDLGFRCASDTPPQ
jgi:rhamnose transport system permease protein